METILSIAGKPGLYKLVSRGKMNLIVESLDESRKRVPTFASDRVTSLADEINRNEFNFVIANFKE